MKALYTLTILVFLSTQLFGQWTIDSTGNANGLTAIQFINDSIGYAAGNNGTIIKTINAGTTWIALNSVTASGGANLACLYFTNADTGFAGGAAGTLISTNDGGNTWISISTGYTNPNTIFSISFVNKAIGYALLAEGEVLRTVDGGNTWALYSAYPSYFPTTYYTSTYFTNPSTGFIAGGSTTGVIYMSIDSGYTWQPTATTTYPLRGMYFVNANIGYAVGSHGTIIKTTNGGTTWTPQSSGIFNDYNYVFFIDSNYGYASSDGGLIKTTDGGNKWMPVAFIGGVPQQIYFVSKCQGFIALNSGTVAKTPVIPTISATSPLIFCMGDSVTLNAIDAGTSYLGYLINAGESYLWSSGQTDSTIKIYTTGNYYVTVIDSNGCSETTPATNIIVNALPTTPIITPDGAITFCAGDSVTLTTGTATTYHWNNNATTQSISVTQTGNYEVTVTNVHNCSATAMPLMVTTYSISTPTITLLGNDTLTTSTYTNVSLR